MDPPGSRVLSRKNPRASANIFSVLTFSWTYDIFRRGFRRDLKNSDLCEPLPEHRAQTLGDKFEECWDREVEAHKHNPKRQPSLIRVISKIFFWKFALYFVCMYLSEFVLRLGQPLLISALLKYFAPNTTVTYNEALLYTIGVVLCVGLAPILQSPCLLACMHLSMKIRVGLSSLIYRKTLKLSKGASSRIGSGHIINILSNDASRLDYLVAYLPGVVSAPIVGMIVVYLMWRQVGYPALIGITVIALLAPLQGVLAKLTATLRYRIATKTDYRIRLIGEIVAGIQVIKMYAWEKSFAKLAAIARRKEIAVVRQKSFTVGVTNSATAFSTKLALYITLVGYVYFGNLFNDDETIIQASVVYFMVLCYTILNDNLISFFPMAISQAIEAYVTIRRMRSFLMSEEATEAIMEEHQTDCNGNIEMKSVDASWSDENTDNTLHDLNVKIQPGSLVAVIGVVGSGKSSLLQLILRELPIKSGKFEVEGTVSYASQEPWVFGGTVRQNILFGLPMDDDKYRRVVRACVLEPDFKQFPSGDMTTIGDNGAGLSGGQKARINLARAVYRDADIYLLDDPLSAVDSHVSKHLFDNCICGYLAGKTVVLATHHVQRLTNVEHVIKMENGKIIAQGSFQELSNIGLNMLAMNEVETSKKEEKDEIDKRMSILSTRGDIEDELIMTSKGTGAGSVYFNYLKAVKSIILLVLVPLTFVLVTVATSGSDYWLKTWINLEETGFPKNLTVPVFGEFNRSFCLNVYGIFIGTLIALAIIRTILHCIMCLRSSVNLHDTLFSSISQATMKFFDETPSGQILNRFSRDLGIIDEIVPERLSFCIRTNLNVLGSLTIIFIVNWYLIVPFLFVAVLLLLLGLYYVTTSRRIKRIESAARSPIYTHVSASLQGLTTIRAMRVQARLREEFDHKIDAHSSAWYYILAANRAFVYYTELACGLYISVVIFSFLLLDKGFLGADVGLAITQCLGLTYLLLFSIRQTVELENDMTAVGRVCEHFYVDSESQKLETPPDCKLVSAWPPYGAIEFHDVSVSYDPAKPPVLKKINFSIKPTEKIGIVGRTGAGKSSLISCLFRLHEVEGKIYIDGLDTSTIGLQDLRSRLSIIPQDPVIFSGTMRFNLDPFEEFSDSDLWNALEEVELKRVVQDAHGLDTNLSEGGVNLSVGQRQLVCLARAILRNSRVLILDEATANVDSATDDFIQAAIRKRFAHCTVLTIAHRLHTIMDSDRILVIDDGKVVEFGPPQVLMSDPNGHFASMAGVGLAKNAEATQ